MLAIHDKRHIQPLQVAVPMEFLKPDLGHAQRHLRKEQCSHMVTAQEAVFIRRSEDGKVARLEPKTALPYA